MEGCSTEAPVFVFYNYHSVPLPPTAIEQLVTFVTSKLPGNLSRFIFCCDVRRTPQDVMDTVESIAKCEIQHFSVARLDVHLSERILRYTSLVGEAVGAVALITAGGYFMPTMDCLQKKGWRVVLFHPPGTDVTLIASASQAVELPIHAVEDEVEKKEDDVENTDEDVLNKNINGLIKMMKSACAVAKENHNNWDTADSQNFYDRNAEMQAVYNNPHQTKGWGQGPPQMPMSSPMSSPMKRNPFQPPQDSFDKPNPFGMNPFEGSAGPQAPFRRPNPKFSPNARNPFGSPGAPAETTPRAPSMRVPGPQCPFWEDNNHVRQMECSLYHPRKYCRFFPNCRMPAEVCNYAHPFCSEGNVCTCTENKDLQINHYEQ